MRYRALMSFASLAVLARNSDHGHAPEAPAELETTVEPEATVDVVKTAVAGALHGVIGRLREIADNVNDPDGKIQVAALADKLAADVVALS